MGENIWVWQQKKWPNFIGMRRLFSHSCVMPDLNSGNSLARTGRIPRQKRDQTLDILLANIIASSKIENEPLNIRSVRSSLAKRLGMI